MKLTDVFIRHVIGTGKVQKLTDGGGLFLYVTPDGKKYWRMAYRFTGKQKLFSIGQYPRISLREAREKREEAKKLLYSGIDPSFAKQEAKSALVEASKNSFEIVAREWYEKNSVNWADTYKKIFIATFERHIFPYIGKRPIGAITARELLEVLRRIEAQGALHIAHRTMRNCGRVFRYAIVTGRAERNVASDLRGALAPENAKHYATITEPKAVGALLSTLEKDVGRFPVQCALRLAPFVFVRAAEMVGAEWSEIDFENAEWRIPAIRMKMRQVHIVPLAKQAISILQELYIVTGTGTYLFPGQRNQATHPTPLASTSLVLALRNLGYTKDTMTFHGFRAMASTLLNELGYNFDWIERQLAHCERNGVRAAYNYAQYLPDRRRMMQEWADYLSSLREQSK